MRLSNTLVRNLEAIAVLGGAIAAWILVPGEILLPAAVVVLAVAVGGVFAIRASVGRLDPDTFRDRRDLLVEVGVLLAMVGLAAFVILLLEFAD